MLKIKIGLIFFSIVSLATAGLINSVSREVMKLIQPRNRSSKILPLQKDLEKDENVKTGEEFEIALATERLGFLYCNVKQEPFMKRFVKEYLNISQGHSALLRTLVPRRMTRAEIRSMIKACNNYLMDDVLRDNGLRLAVVDDDLKIVQAVERVIQFDYFSAQPYKFAVLQCPVKMDNPPDTKVKTIFFSALGSTEDESEKDDKRKKNVDGAGRPYYVFTDYTQLDKTKFKILMRTIQQDPRRSFTEGSPRTEKIKSRIYDNPQRSPIHLHVRPERFNDGFRLFGKDAEAAFLTEKLRFFNKSYSRNKINRFLDTILEMKTGYEIHSYYEWISKFNKDRSSELSVTDTSIPFDCPKYVKGAKSLQKYGPIFRKDYSIKFITPVPMKIPMKITGKSLQACFYQCPVTFTSEEYAGKATVNVIPITYRSSENCEEHAIYYVIVNKNTSNEHKDYFFSRVEEAEEYFGVVKSVEPVIIDKPVENVDPGVGVEPVGGFVPAEGAKSREGVKPDERVKPVSGVKPVKGVKSIGGTEPVGAIESVGDVDSDSSEDSSGRIRAVEPYSHEDDNEADVSGISGSIGMSGELGRGTN